ncbi:MAG: diguanylate cyclase [Clostridia bacterium]|nr:diguanylate cyclase [Clostridia bacterium]
MKTFGIFRYLRKLLPLIIVLCLFATYAAYYKLSTSNTYTASEVIHYNDEQAEQGLAPTGDKLDVNEIKSSAVMSKVVDKMGLTGIYSVDSLISRINISPVEDKDKVAQKEAKLEEGEEYIYEPSTYIVSFTASSSEGSAFARTILDETLDVYFAEFSQKYVNVAPANNTIENLDKANYDYLEIVELIDTNIEETTATLYQRIEKSPYYRASGTGTSFNDLAEEFNYLRDVKVSWLFSEIYKYQLTKNKDVLVSDYTTRIENNGIANNKDDSLVDDIVTIIDEYVTKMRDSGNTNITHEYILDDLHDRNLQDYFGDQTVTYDELIYDWKDHNESKEHALIDSAYCTYVIDTFTSCTGRCGGKCTGSSLTCSELSDEDYKSVRANVESELGNLLTELDNLYKTTMKTNDEYNEYLGSSYISVKSTSSVAESVNVTLYTIIAFVFFVVVCCGGAILLARLGDIINYIFYTDHLTGFNNRAYFDKYLKSKDKKLLDDGVVYCTVDIANLAHINGEYSREIGDEIIKMFTDYIKEAFGKTKAEFIYNGNGSFVVLADEVDYITVEDIMRLFRLRLEDREENKDVVIEYKIGIAETFKENKTSRKLLSEAIKNKKSFVSDLSTKEE